MERAELIQKAFAITPPQCRFISEADVTTDDPVPLMQVGPVLLRDLSEDGLSAYIGYYSAPEDDRPTFKDAMGGHIADAIRRLAREAV